MTFSDNEPAALPARWLWFTLAALATAALVAVLINGRVPQDELPDLVRADPLRTYDPVDAGEIVPDGFRQLLERDQIEPVYAPAFTSADQVDWPLDMLVVAVAGASESKAYPVTHLNEREMVIDHIDGEPILVSW
jgi:uncharacterized membrane protein